MRDCVDETPDYDENLAVFKGHIQIQTYPSPLQHNLSS